MKWYLQVLKKYSDFAGRARRKEYWMFILFNLIFLVIAILLDNLAGTNFKVGEGDAALKLPYGYIYLIYAIAVIIPGLAVTVRRLHDTGKSGWMIFICLIPIIGAIWFLVLMLTEGNRGPNGYGPDPKEQVVLV